MNLSIETGSAPTHYKNNCLKEVFKNDIPTVLDILLIL